MAASLLAVASCTSTAPTQDDTSARLRLNILDALSPVSAPVGTWLPLSLAAIQTGDAPAKIWAAGRSKAPAKVDQRAMRTASISKLAVAYGAMALVEQGVLDLDEDISVYLGWSLRHPDYPAKPITVRQLLSHQSSLVDGGAYQFGLSVQLEDVLADPRYFLAGQGPGDYFTYSNIGYGVLATVMEAATQTRFDILMDQLVFVPAGLDIGFNWHSVSLSKQAQALPIGRYGVDVKQVKTKPIILIETLEAPDFEPKLAQELAKKAQQEQGEGRDNVPDAKLKDEFILIFKDADPILPEPTRTALEQYVPGTNATIFSPQGGLRASLQDVVKLGEILRRSGKIGSTRILKAGTVKRMKRPQWRLNKAASNGDDYGGLMTSFGLGVQIYEPNEDCFEAKRKRYYGHFGEAHGLLGGLLVDPKSDQSFVYLLPYTPVKLSAALSTCSGLYQWEEQFLKTALAP